MGSSHHVHAAVTNADIFIAAPIEDCTLVFHFEAVIGAIATSSTSFLFLSRIRAVYEKSMIVTAVFGTFWAAIFISSVGLVALARETVSRA